MQTLGEIGEKETENKVLLLEHDIPHQPFSKAVLDCLPVLPWIITDAVSYFLNASNYYYFIQRFKAYCCMLINMDQLKKFFDGGVRNNYSF